MSYNFKEIEAKWQQRWEENPYFKAQDDFSKKKFYCLDMFPYPSASGLHVGHWKGYVFSDVFARQKLLQGYNVLHPMGWDAFGLPAENDAIKKGVHPKGNTAKNIAAFKVQLRKIGAIYDWSREVDTTDPEYYKWTQWIFLKMFEKGLAYEETVPVNWCPKCLTGLANEEACGGTCDRCGTAVEQKPLRQWVLKITEYSDALDDDLDLLEWPEKVKLMQRNWIGRSHGAQITFGVENSDIKLTVFTTRADTINGVSFVVLAPDHELVAQLITSAQSSACQNFIAHTKNMTDMEKMLCKDRSGVFTGSYAINPFSGAKVPVFLANYVLKHYGTGMVMGVPAHDERDFDFAKKYELPVNLVVQPNTPQKDLFDESGKMLRAFTEGGLLVNTPGFDGLSAPEEAAKKLVAFLRGKGLAMPVVTYKIRDWVFSRQRYWGEPIPLIHCQNCGTLALREEDLPLRLPEVESYQPSHTGESPLATIPEWVNVSCHKCGGPAKRETNTMPQWAGSCWYFLRYASPNFKDKIVDQKALEYWLPVDFYVGGIEHAVLHLLYARFYIKFLHEIGVVKFKEPFLRLFNQGMVCMKSTISGRVEKMSKSKGNVVDPDKIVEDLGSDSLRLYMLFMGPAEQDTEWQTESILGVHNFLKRVWEFVNNPANLCLGQQADEKTVRRFHIFLKDFSERVESFKVNTAVASCMELFNDLSAQKLKLDKTLLAQFLTVFSIMVPHFSSELLEKVLGLSLANMHWPNFDPALAKKDQLEIPIQINGKLRATISVAANLGQQEVIALARQAAAKWLDGQAVKKEVFIAGRLVNFVV